MSTNAPSTAGEHVENAVNRHSNPSDLRITDMRLAVVLGNLPYPIIKLETNQGVFGLGEVRDGGHAENALQFKHMLLGQNPCDVDMIFRRIKRFGGPGREGGGVSGIEIALWDLVGKVYGVPCYQLLGGKYRERVRIYGDTPAPEKLDAEGYGKAVKSRLDLGLTFIKFDIKPALFEATEDGYVGTKTRYENDFYKRWRAPGSGPGARLTDRGIARAAEIVGAMREAVGPEVSLCIDHFGEGASTEDECIRLSRGLEPYSLAWMEDPMPWHDIAGHKRVTDASVVPIAGGEDLYLWDGFREACETRAFDILHPDLLTSGGMLETKRIADYGELYGQATALHCACSPIGFMANVHCAAAIGSLLAVEHHGLDLPWYTDLVSGLDPDYMSEGYVTVPTAPGLGLDLVEEAVEAHLMEPGTMWQSTEAWNTPKLDIWHPARKLR
ncbi:MAG: mandelate racemase/muconate lactonizing enzyme family protein [Pseudomonadota bacterium]